MNGIKLLALDPALRNVGLALLFVGEDGSVQVENLRLLKTENEAGKTVRKNSDDLRRARESFSSIMDWVMEADMLAAEVPSGSQSARGTMSNGISIGLLAAASLTRPLIEVSAAEAKKVATGRKNATKDEMIQWAKGLYPNAPWLTRRLRGQTVMIDANEHLADAVAIGHAALQTPAFQLALKMKRASFASTH